MNEEFKEHVSLKESLRREVALKYNRANQICNPIEFAQRQHDLLHAIGFYIAHESKEEELKK